MRDLFHNSSGRPGDELAGLCGLVCASMRSAGNALWDSDLALAQQVITAQARIRELGTRCARDQCAQLVRSGPATADGRRSLAVMTAADTMVRMGEAAGHIAEVARARHPRPAVPGAPRDLLRRMSQLVLRSGCQLEQTLAVPVDACLIALERVEDELGWLHRQLLDTLACATPPCPEPVVGDATSLARHYERFASLAVVVGRRLEQAVTGEPSVRVVGTMSAAPGDRPWGRDASTVALKTTDFWAEHPLTRFFRTAGSAQLVLDTHRRGAGGQCLTCSVDRAVDYPCTQVIHAELALRPPPRAADQLFTLAGRGRSRAGSPLRR